jgi:hypothetical protein
MIEKTALVLSCQGCSSTIDGGPRAMKFVRWGVLEILSFVAAGSNWFNGRFKKICC